MKIKNITIKNVKSFRDKVSINFNKDLNIFIGPNGGGKSNLLDIITTIMRGWFLPGYYEFDQKPEPYSDSMHLICNNYTPPIDPIPNTFSTYDVSFNKSLDKFIGDNSDLEIGISFEISCIDIENMEIIKNNIKKFQKEAEKKGIDITYYVEEFKKLDTRVFYPGEIISCRLDNNGFKPGLNINPPHWLFLKYLQRTNPDWTMHSLYWPFFNYLRCYNIFNFLAKEIDNITLTDSYLYFPPSRTEKIKNLEVCLSDDSFKDLLKSFWESNSKTTSSLLKLATYHFAEKMRLYEINNKENYLIKWKEDKEVIDLNKYLGKLGYSFKLKLTNPNRNIYEIILIKNETEFHVNQASSGEREIINFLFGIFTFNIKNSFIVIEEPELHLHPTWQLVLMEIFSELSNDRDNQFIFSTHSPSLITPKTISNVFRVYKDKTNSSKIKKIGEDFEDRSILDIVKSHNNEKMFFADKTVLVEGISDRLIFEKLINIYSDCRNKTYTDFKNKSEIIEVIDVGGKGNLLDYRKLLDDLDVNNFIIADRDYLKDENIGDKKVRTFFENTNKKICEKAINKKSKDCKALMAELEYIIENNGDISGLKEIFGHIKKRCTTLKMDLEKDEIISIDSCIKNLKLKNIYILKKGELEDYLPQGYKNKNINKYMELVKDSNINKLLNVEDNEEIESIIFDILEIKETERIKISNMVKSNMLKNLTN